MPQTRPGPQPEVLVANDQEWAVRSLESILGGHGIKVHRAFTGRQALHRMETAHVDAVILDAQMPDLDGYTVCRTIRADPLFGPALPIFITTAGPSGRRERVSAYEAGAWEFFGFPLDPELLILKLGLFLEAKMLHDRITADALVDDDTGFYNTRGMRRRVRELAAQAARGRESLGCVVLRPASPVAEDTHLAMRAAASRLAGHLSRIGRRSDAIGRIDLARFAIVGFGIDATTAAELDNRLRAAMRADVAAGAEALTGLAEGFVVEVVPLQIVGTGEVDLETMDAAFGAAPEAAHLASVVVEPQGRTRTA